MDYERLKKIFNKSAKNVNCIATQEGYTVEYKQAFGWGNIADYARAMAAMANNRGGHIIFGIKDKPHELIGLERKSIDKFNEKDLAKWSEILRDLFEPNIFFEKELFEYCGKVYGVVQIEKAMEKPIICKKYIENKLRIGAVYYRYKAENTEIQYAELRHIIDEEKDKINVLWMQKIKQIGMAGVSNTMILNTNNAVLEGSSKSLYIGEELIEKIRFVDRGHFIEKEGEPVLTIVGEVKSVKDTPIQIAIEEKEIALSDNRIVEAFLQTEDIKDGKEYLSFILNSSVRNLPVFFYLSKIDTENESLENIVSEIVGFKSNTDLILNRIRSMKFIYYEELRNTGTEAFKNKAKYRDQLLNNKEIVGDSNTFKYLFATIRSLDSKDIIKLKEVIINKLFEIYKRDFRKADTNFRGEFRKAICYIDEVLYKK